MGWFASKQENLNERLRNACGKGKLAEIERLLAAGADINAKDSEGNTPLVWAIYDNQPEAVRLLIEKGADVKTVVGKDKKTLLIYACGFTEENIVKQLLQTDIDVNAKDREGVSALHRAAGRGNDNIVLALIEKGANLHERTDNGRTPLHWAASGGNFSAVKLLLEKGADANAIDKDGNKPETNARKYYPGIADFLRDKTAIPAVPAPATGWRLTAPDEIVCTSEKEGTDYCLTEIFNFTSRIYNRIARNMKTNAESQAIRFFDEFPDKTLLEAAYQMLAKQGGKADRSSIHGTVLDKKSL